jgi:hypothetical protein
MGGERSTPAVATKKRSRAVEPRPVDERLTPAIRQTLEAGLTRLRGRPIRIQDIGRQFSMGSSSFPTERLRVSLKGERRPLLVFFKDLNPNHQMEKARAVRALDLEPGRRELQMYETILSPERFGTLHLYGYRWEPERDRFWAFFEDGGRTVLHNHLDMPRWTAAARWAARFHAATHGLPDTQTRFLPRYDETHYRRCAERVEQLLPQLTGAEHTLVARGLECFVDRIEWLSALPRCVFHGQYFGKNILLRRSRHGPKVVVIDWETAALGPGTFDLVSLTSGKWTSEQREAMRRAYREQYEAETGRRIDEAAFREELTGVALYQALEWLAWWGPHRALSRHFGNFIRELATLLEEENLAPGATQAAGVG